MTDATDTPAPPKPGKIKTILIAAAMAVIGAAIGFFAVQSGVLSSTSDQPDHGTDDRHDTAETNTLAFVPIAPLIISLPGDLGQHHLRFAAQLEVPPDRIAQVEEVLPRIIDILNGYLRALDPAELRDPTILLRMRAQMLRRAQIVAGDGMINDLLIMEFVIS